MTTLDFELEINPGTAGGYQVTARAPGGEVASTLRWSLTTAELDHQLAVIKDKVLVSSAVLRRAPTEDEQPVRELGQRLFDALIADDVRALYVASRQRARENGCVLRLVLRVHPPELARLPWEFLFDPSRQDYLGLTLPLVRYLQVLAPRQPLRVAAPLRILDMVARPGDQHALDGGAEQQRLQAALAGLQREGLVELGWVGGQTYGDLEDALDSGPWHVFHFVGHGGYDWLADEGTLALADETGRTHPVGADDLSRLLAEHYPLRLVVLNACDTGRGSAADAFSSTAAALIRREIPAVVAMQFEITDSAAIQFAQTFYQHVAKRRPVDDSVRRARVALRLAKKDTLEWGTPVLYLRALDGRIFDAIVAPSPQLGPSPNPMPAPKVAALPSTLTRQGPPAPPTPPPATTGTRWTGTRWAQPTRPPMQLAAVVLSVMFVLVGVLGFIPGVTTDGDASFGEQPDALLLGIFEVSVLHNILHLAFGVVGLAMSRTAAAARTFLIGGGLIYVVLWLYGLVIDLDGVANFVPLNVADNWLHLALAASMIALSVVLPRRAD